MTAQQRDEIIIDDEIQALLSFPLDEFLIKYTPYIKLISTNTACSRGYVAKWLLENNTLYLIGFQGNMGSYSQWENIELDYLFPASDKIKAWWFSSTFYVSIGEPINCYRNFGYVFEEYLVIEINSGEVENSYKEKVDLDPEQCLWVIT